jgi:O-antigen ligase
LLNPTASSFWEYFSYIQIGDWIDIHPAYFSMYLVFCVIILAQEMFDKMKIKLFGLAVIAVFTLFIVLLSSRMAIVAYLVVTSFLAVYNFSRTRDRRILIIPALFLLTLFALVWINPVSRFRIVQEPLFTSFHIDQNKKEWNSVSFRLLEWKASLHELERSWMTGVGTGDGQAVLQNYYSAYNTSTANLNYNAHNQYLQTTLELGVTGLILLLICIFKPAFHAIQPNPVHIAFVVLFGLMCFTESLLARQKGIVFFTMFQSLLFRCTHT